MYAYHFRFEVIRTTCDYAVDVGVYLWFGLVPGELAYAWWMLF